MGDRLAARRPYEQSSSQPVGQKETQWLVMVCILVTDCDRNDLDI